MSNRLHVEAVLLVLAFKDGSKATLAKFFLK